MKKITTIFLMGLILSGCVLSENKSESVDTSSVNVTLMGTIQSSKGDGTYVFKKSDGTIGELHDGRVNLQSYVGKTITVTGQYSGTTLYVDEVK